MNSIIGSGAHRYRVDTAWGALPPGWILGDVAAVATDSHDRLFVFNRSDHPIIVLDSDGSFITSWGEDLFTHAHGLEITDDDLVYCTDDGDHTVRRCTLEGEVLLEIGTSGRPAPFMSGLPFRRCTQTAVAPDGFIYVSDGYGNNRVHCYRPDGELLHSFGRSGVGPGEFNFPHSVCCDDEGRVYVTDRENHRIQIFDGAGRYLAEWRGLHRPTSICRLPGPGPVWLVGEIGPDLSFNRGAPNLGPRLSVLDANGGLLARLGLEPGAGTRPGQFLSPHGLCCDSRGAVYIAQPSVTAWRALFPDQPIPKVLPSLQKLVPV